MDEIYNWISKNHQWFFSGLGVLILSLVITYLLRRKRRADIHIGDSISVRGRQNIGKVEGKEKIEIKFNDQQKKKD